jgi:hypothetical protein
LQPNTGSGDFVADKVMAIVVMIGALCGGCGGLALAGLGGLVGGLGAAGAAGSAGQTGAAEAATVAAAGGITMVLGILFLILAVVAFIGAIGMLKTQRKGFNLTMISMALLTVLGIILMVTGGGAAQSIVGIVIDLAIAGYCWGRLNGKIGPANLV